MTHHSKYKYHLAIAGLFCFILLTLILTSFKGISLTGNAIKTGGYNSSESILIFAEMEDLPILSLDQNIQSLIIRGVPNSYLHIGNEKVPLKGTDNSIELKNYEGKISFDEKNIFKLEGKVSKLSINGLSIVPHSDDLVKIYFDEEVSYDYLEIKRNIFIKKLNYIARGKITLDKKTIIELNRDNLIIEKFYGDIEIRNNKAILQGNIEELDIEGNQQISISI